MRKFRDYENSNEFSFSHLPRKILSKGLFEKYICWNFDYGKHEENRSWIISHQKQIVGVTCETCAVKTEVRASAPIQLELKTRNENTDLIVQKYG
jgi:hypothetical protein